MKKEKKENKINVSPRFFFFCLRSLGRFSVDRVDEEMKKEKKNKNQRMGRGFNLNAIMIDLSSAPNVILRRS